MYARPRTLSGKEARKKAGSMEEMSTYFVSRYHQGYFPGMRQCMQGQRHSQLRKQARKLVLYEGKHGRNVNLLCEQISPRVFSWDEAMYARPKTLSVKEASKKACTE